MMLMYHAKVIHVSYFAGNEDDFRVRMNLYFNENYAITHMRWYCYIDDEIRCELPQENITLFGKLSLFEL